MKWEDKNNSGLPTKSFTFAGAESKIVQHTVTNITTSGDYWSKLYIDTPNHQWFGPINFHVNLHTIKFGSTQGAFYTDAPCFYKGY